jgi:hypothetical protein
VKLVNALSLLGALAIGSTVSGCMTDSGSSSANTADAQIVVQAGVRDVNKVNGLTKTSVIKLKKMVITLTSSDTSDAVKRDTILANDSVGSTFTTTATADQVFAKSISVKPLRSWTVEVKTLDDNDSVIHSNSQLVSSLLVGETRAVTINLTSRFVMYEAKFSLPDSLNFTLLSLKQQLAITRVVMTVDGDTVVDSTRTPRFAIAPTVNSVRFDYISVNDTPDVKLEFYGRIGADTTVSKLFQYEFENVNPDSTSPTPVQAVYTGPNSTQLSAITGLNINIGKVGTVVFEPVIDPNVTTKKGAK